MNIASNVERLMHCEDVIKTIEYGQFNTIKYEYTRAVERRDESAAAETARKLRNILLSESDNRCTLDRIVTEIPESDTFEAWLPLLREIVGCRVSLWGVYRQHLRDIPEQQGFPFEIDWGEPPEVQ